MTATQNNLEDDELRRLICVFAEAETGEGHDGHNCGNLSKMWESIVAWRDRSVQAQENRLIASTLERVKQSVQQHTVPEGWDLVTRSYVMNTIDFELAQLSRKEGDTST